MPMSPGIPVFSCLLTQFVHLHVMPDVMDEDLIQSLLKNIEVKYYPTKKCPAAKAGFVFWDKMRKEEKSLKFISGIKKMDYNLVPIREFQNYLKRLKTLDASTCCKRAKEREGFIEV